MKIELTQKEVDIIIRCLNIASSEISKNKADDKTFNSIIESVENDIKNIKYKLIKK